MNFSERLRKSRKEKGFSQEELADRIGISRQAVSKWESGQSNPDTNNLIMLSELYGISLDVLLKGDQEKVEEITKVINRRFHYEYKSKRKVFGIPLVHINIGLGIYEAKGIIAMGNISRGLISLGIVSLGMLSFGVVAIGLISIASIAIGILGALGGIAIGTIAIGGVAMGVITLGGLSIGMYSVGGCSIASEIAIGNYARGHIAIGSSANGVRTIIDTSSNGNFANITAAQIENLIKEEYPKLWDPIVHFMTMFL
ncbi:helix-turn-helix domain-containing protein [Clostridium estertheticum]|uniref:helix-turn-helix domain-containing protein n=1 Tax=Clostridium estertheticum TaxID=238834 RepID=UPI0013EE5422|nr:helix-turn-helix transcriptional regulator [Clostridium estertheticum]MBZ9607462.1 helix-turn-helix domain-containing protein [Clostridium estertheticum]